MAEPAVSDIGTQSLKERIPLRQYIFTIIAKIFFGWGNRRASKICNGSRVSANICGVIFYFNGIRQWVQCNTRINQGIRIQSTKGQISFIEFPNQEICGQIPLIGYQENWHYLMAISPFLQSHFIHFTLSGIVFWLVAPG